MIWRALFLYTSEHAGQTSSRRFPQAIRRTPPGSSAVSYMSAARPVALSMASMRPSSRIGWAQWPVAASWASQRWKSSLAARFRRLSVEGRGEEGRSRACGPAKRPDSPASCFPSVFSQRVITVALLACCPGRCPHPQAGFGPGGERDGRDRHAAVISRTRESARCLSGSGRIRVWMSGRMGAISGLSTPCDEQSAVRLCTCRDEYLWPACRFSAWRAWCLSIGPPGAYGDSTPQARCAANRI